MLSENAQVFTMSEIQTGLGLTIEVSKSENVAKLKSVLQLKLDIPGSDLLLFYSGEELEDSYGIRDIDASAGSKIMFMDRRSR